MPENENAPANQNRESRLLRAAKFIVRRMNKALGEEFTPQNVMGLVHTKREKVMARVSLHWLRKAQSVAPLDEVQMLVQVSAVARLVRVLKQGNCGELAMYAYNMARLIPDTLPQIIMLPANEGTDHHAFVLLGVATKFAEETPISRIAQQYPGAVVIDYWAVQNGYSEYQGAFPIGVFDTETEDSLDKYDKERAKTWNYS